MTAERLVVQIELTPYAPEHGADVIYHPAEKGARVLVGLQFEGCFVERRLGWRMR